MFNKLFAFLPCNIAELIIIYRIEEAIMMPLANCGSYFMNILFKLLFSMLLYLVRNVMYSCLIQSYYMTLTSVSTYMQCLEMMHKNIINLFFFNQAMYQWYISPSFLHKSFNFCTIQNRKWSHTFIWKVKIIDTSKWNICQIRYIQDNMPKGTGPTK